MQRLSPATYVAHSYCNGLSDMEYVIEVPVWQLDRKRHLLDGYQKWDQPGGNEVIRLYDMCRVCVCVCVYIECFMCECEYLLTYIAIH